MYRLQRNGAPQTPPALRSFRGIVLPGSVVARPSPAPRSCAYTPRGRGTICTAALIPALGTGPSIDKTNLLPPLVHQAVCVTQDRRSQGSGSYFCFFPPFFFWTRDSSDCPCFSKCHLCWMVQAIVSAIAIIKEERCSCT